MAFEFSGLKVQDLEQFDHDDPDIEQHFSKEELLGMSEYEKTRLRNIKRNFLAMNALGKTYTFQVSIF